MRCFSADGVCAVAVSVSAVAASAPSILEIIDVGLRSCRYPF
jgi:hypothetical protein